MKDLSRKDKLKMLQAIKDGHLNPAALRPRQVYIFMEKSTMPGYYEHNGKLYSKEEYEEKVEQIRNSRGIVFNEYRSYEETDLIITMNYKGPVKPGDLSLNL